MTVDNAQELLYASQQAMPTAAASFQKILTCKEPVKIAWTPASYRLILWMKIKSLHFKNFRCLVDVSIDLDDVTVIIGENNTGKTAVLDGLRFITSRAPQRRQATIAEYDFHMADKNSDPKKSDPAIVELTVAESKTDEWPEEITQSLNEIIQTDPVAEIDSINLRCSSKYNDITKAFESVWEFLTIKGDPLGGKALAPGLISAFLKYIPYFYLSALRNVEEEFSPRSQFWGKILRSVDIPEEKRQALSESLEELNSELLDADPRLKNVASTVGQISSVMHGPSKHDVAIRALPLKPWDLMSKSEIVLKSKHDGAQFPITRYGQGTQSLSVLFLFQAFVEHLLKDMYTENSEPILALEEPEAHLHPQAARALWDQVIALRGQRIISSHSPHFVENVPFRKLRMFRRAGVGVNVYSVPEAYSAIVPNKKELQTFVAKNPAKFVYEETAEELSVHGSLSETEYRELLVCYTSADEKAIIHPVLKSLRDRSRFYLSDTDLAELQTAVRRIRGEILFARCWLLCEGQSEYVLLHGFAELLGTPLDVSGIAVIDFQNSGGAPAQFAILAHSLGFPWMLQCDGDAEGDKFIGAIKQAFAPSDVSGSCYQLNVQDLEEFFVKNGLESQLDTICRANNRVFTTKAGDAAYKDELAMLLRQIKGQWPRMLVDSLKSTVGGSALIPPFFTKLIKDCVNVAG